MSGVSTPPDFPLKRFDRLTPVSSTGQAMSGNIVLCCSGAEGLP